METTPRIARLEQRICLDGWKMEQEGTDQLIEWAFQNKPKDQVWLLDQLFPSRSHLQKWKTDVRRWQCQVDKAQASHQLHPEQLCKFRLSIPSKNVVERQRGSLNHRMTMDLLRIEGREWKAENGRSDRHEIIQEMKGQLKQNCWEEVIMGVQIPGSHSNLSFTYLTVGKTLPLSIPCPSHRDHRDVVVHAPIAQVLDFYELSSKLPRLQT